MDHTELRAIIKQTVLETAIEVNEAYHNHGTLICRSEIIREIGLALYDQGVISGKLNPKRRNEGAKGKLWIQMKDYLRYKSELFT